MNIVFSSDNNLLWVLPTVLNSIYYNNKHLDLKIHLLYSGDLTDEEIQLKINNFIKYDLDITIYKINTEDLGFEYNGLCHVSRATMNRLFIENVLKEVEGRLLYLDLDVIVNCDLNIFNEIEINPKTGISARTEFLNWCQRWNKKHAAYQYTKPYNFNAGVILFDLDILRKNNFTKKAIEIWKCCPSYNDQMILNIYCDGEYSKLPDKLNIFAGEKRHPDLQLIKDVLKSQEDFIIHYTGDLKPWHDNYSHPLKELKTLWRKFSNETY